MNCWGKKLSFGWTFWHVGVFAGRRGCLPKRVESQLPARSSFFRGPAFSQRGTIWVVLHNSLPEKPP